eukprot:2510502-Amphidinium_carterae.1
MEPDCQAPQRDPTKPNHRQAGSSRRNTNTKETKSFSKLDAENQRPSWHHWQRLEGICQNLHAYSKISPGRAPGSRVKAHPSLVQGCAR